MSAAHDLHAVLLALAGDTLLLPNAAIAEILSFDRLRPPKSSGSPWLAGTIPYQDRVLRVIQFEAMNGGSGEIARSRRTRVAILHGVTGKLPTGQYGVVCQGHPNLVMLNREALKSDSRHASDRQDLVLARVRIANANALIPNLELIEAELAKLDERR